MVKLFSWQKVSRNGDSYSEIEKDIFLTVFRITRLPDFSDHRFDYLSREIDQRESEVLQRQIAMIRRLHALGNESSITIRLKKEKDHLELFLIIRSTNQIDSVQITESLPHEYSFETLKEELLSEALNLSWARKAAVILKEEKEFKGDIYPTGDFQQLYVPFQWTQANNTMENICQSMMNFNGMCVIDITISPTSFLEDERAWLNVNLGRLKECMNGEVIKAEKTGRIIWQGKKIPILRTPIDNCEKLSKQYESSRVFLTAIRVFGDNEVNFLANSLLTNSVRNEGVILLFSHEDRDFSILKSCSERMDISPNIRSKTWVNIDNERKPYRAQRLSTLSSVEEVIAFFRLPISLKKNFPGFGYDTGLQTIHTGTSLGKRIVLGQYLDENRQTVASFEFKQLAKHGLIVGVPGSGKTTAMFNILYQLWDQSIEERIPFIILEPAKTEYRALKKLDLFKDDMLVFSLGDESVSPFRFNPLEVLPGVKVESHISKLLACFVGAFDMFDPLPYILEKAIRKTYSEKGWYDDSIGGEEGLEIPTLSDLSRNADFIIQNSGFDDRIKSDLNASLLERLNSLRTGSKGRMLDTKHSISAQDLMQRPVVLELDSLNANEKSLMMMFLLSFVFEYCKVNRRSGSPLKHMLLVEEAHNLISSSGSRSDNRANPQQHTIELFVNMLAEMRALGQGILIADQLPTAIAPQAVKQTNVKILMRITAKDDREEIGNTMDLNEEQMHQVVNFKTGNAYIYHEGEDSVRSIKMINFKGEHSVEEPPSDEELSVIMEDYEKNHLELYLPYSECSKVCIKCNRRVRSQAETFLQKVVIERKTEDYYHADDSLLYAVGSCGFNLIAAGKEKKRIQERYGKVSMELGGCIYVHMLNRAESVFQSCKSKCKKCHCTMLERETYLQKYSKIE